MKLAERDLEIDFTDAIDGLVFDQINPALPNFHGISTMHRVDFIVELQDSIYFVEVKDPSNPNAEAEDLRRFHIKLSSGSLASSFASKFMCSFAYRWAEKKINKPVHYVSLVTLESALLLNLSDEIAKKLPPTGIPVNRWQRPFLVNCQVFNIDDWNAIFDKWPVTRISEQRA